MIALIVSVVVVLAIFALPTLLHMHKKRIAEESEKNWAEIEAAETTTIYVRYGKYDIPILKSQEKAWNDMTPDQKWWMLEHLKAEVAGGRLSTEKKDGITKFTGITNKAKDIKHRQNKRTQEWNLQE